MSEKLDSNLNKANCIEQTRKFFKSNEDYVNQIIKIIEDYPESNFDIILQVVNTIRKQRYSKIHSRISAIFFSNLIVFSYENSKFYTNSYKDILGYANSIFYTLRNEDYNFMLNPKIDKYCLLQSKKVLQYPLTSRFDTKYTLYVNDTSKVNFIVYKLEDKINKLEEDINYLDNENKRLDSLVTTKDIVISEKNILISHLENQIIELKNNFQFYKIFFDNNKHLVLQSNQQNQYNQQNQQNQYNQQNQQNQYNQQNQQNQQNQYNQQNQQNQYNQQNQINTNGKRMRTDDYIINTTNSIINQSTYRQNI